MFDKVELLIVVEPAFHPVVVLNVTLVRLLQLENALSLILVTPSPIITLVRLLQPENA